MGCQCPQCTSKKDGKPIKTPPSFNAHLSGMGYVEETVTPCPTECVDVDVTLISAGGGTPCLFTGQFACGEVLMQIEQNGVCNLEVVSGAQEAAFSEPAGGFDCSANNTMHRDSVTGAAPNKCDLSGLEVTVSPGT
jgi:hypothetical protein